MAKPVTKLLTVIALTAPAAANPPTTSTAPTAAVRAVVATAASTPTRGSTPPTSATPGRPGWFAAQLRMMRALDLFRASAPRTLASGAPACGNVMTKGPRPPCEGDGARVIAERAR